MGYYTRKVKPRVALKGEALTEGRIKHLHKIHRILGHTKKAEDIVRLAPHYTPAEVKYFQNLRKRCVDC